MAKGPLVTDEIKALIASVYQKHPKWKAPVVRNEVSYILREKNPKLPPGWPSLSTVQKVLAIVREPHLDLLDKPWSLATMDNPDNYPISPEALPAVLEVWKSRLEEWKSRTGQWESRIEQEVSFTIREAKWVARLSALFKDDLQRLSKLASQYARLELIYQLINRPFDSTMADKLLIMEVPIIANAADRLEALLPLLAGREDGVDQIRDMKQGKIEDIYLGRHKQRPDPNQLKHVDIVGEKDIRKKSKGGKVK